MIQFGRWAILIVLGISAVANVISGVAFAAGLAEPDLQGMTIPEGQEDAIKMGIGVATAVVGVLIGFLAWGLYGWRKWARIATIAVCVLQLLALVVMSFMAPLPVAAIVSGLLVILILLWLFNGRVEAAFASGGPQP